MAFDEDKATHAAARGDEAAQIALAGHFLGRARSAQSASEVLSWTLVAMTFAMLAASQGLVSNVRYYTFVIRARLDRGDFLAGCEQQLRDLHDRLEAAVAGKEPTDRVEVVV